jgi:hypothetical protein
MANFGYPLAPTSTKYRWIFDPSGGFTDWQVILADPWLTDPKWPKMGVAPNYVPSISNMGISIHFHSKEFHGCEELVPNKENEV